MRDSRPPFKFDLRDILARACRHVSDHVSGVTINLPFVSVSVNPNATEKKIAKEILIRLADKRVLNAFECCDDCINHALASLREIRSFLVGKQVELADFTDGALYLLVELMLEGIRQFFTFEERLRTQSGVHLNGALHDRARTTREKYFAALEMLRAHLHRCLLQVSAIADTNLPKISDHMSYDRAWQTEAYVELTTES
ncbi:MAG: hypothetical protein NUW23_03050 [Firmicutes bacterium]|jgi:hypothetical protein|nr:hypothetical protein [Bacillota bacterium]